MDTAEIRRRFVAHFERAAHTAVPSASLILDDPNLLFVNAGMVPFKPYFLGQETPPYQRAVSVQKCVRTPDIEDVGKTTRHGTFFEMCGNFSFGDYFKEHAIELAWDLVTRSQNDGGYGLEAGRLWPSILHGDDEALQLWMKVTGLPAERIVKLGPKENYWSMGVPGPGGPCSEILYDRGPEYGPDGDFETTDRIAMPAKLEDRYLEIWNLVFMQDELSAVRAKDDFDIVGPLPSKNIDTGMGLERVACLLQGVDNMYEIDEMYPVIERAEELTGRRYGAGGQQGHDDDVRFRVVGDHVRSSMMLIGDGVTPGNEGRGYVLRRLLRRAVRSMRLLGTEDTVLPELMPVSRDKMGETYADLHRDWERISQVAYAEEQAFRQTLRAGTQIFDLATTEVKHTGGHTLSGEQAFALHDTYGFPIDLTLEMAQEQGLEVDEVGFRELMDEQRRRAKADAAAKKGGHLNTAAYRRIADELARPVEFTGYREVVTEGSVRGLLWGGEVVEAAREGDDVELVLDRTPFYAEGGGQLADQGVIELENGARVEVRDVQTPIRGLIVHSAKVLSGEVTPGIPVQSRVDVERRKSISRAHTATHMVHKAFREALGETATQAGSENAPGRFRFDFSATGAVPVSVMEDVEARVNDLVLADLARARRDHDPGGGRAVGRDGALRREVRRPGARDLGGRLGARAVRRHPRRALGQPRRGQAAGGVVHRLRRTTRRGARRERRLPVPRPGARARRAALRGAQGASRGAARAGQRHRRAPAHGREGARADPDRPAAVARRPARGRRRGHPRGQADQPAHRRRRRGRRPHHGPEPPQPAEPGAARRRRADRGQGRQGRPSWPRPTTAPATAASRRTTCWAR